jgi:hypothetical protein
MKSDAYNSGLKQSVCVIIYIEEILLPPSTSGSRFGSEGLGCGQYGFLDRGIIQIIELHFIM